MFTSAFSFCFRGNFKLWSFGGVVSIHPSVRPSIRLSLTLACLWHTTSQYLVFCWDFQIFFGVIPVSEAKICSWTFVGLLEIFQLHCNFRASRHWSSFICVWGFRDLTSCLLKNKCWKGKHQELYRYNRKKNTSAADDDAIARAEAVYNDDADDDEDVPGKKNVRLTTWSDT